MAKTWATARPGDVWTAREVNEIRALLARLERLNAAGGIELRQGVSGQHFLGDRLLLLLVELDEHLAADERDKTANVLHAAPGEDGFQDSGRDIGGVADPQQGVYLKGERHLLWPHASSGAKLIAPGVQWHLAEANETLPAEGSGEVTIQEWDGASEAASGIVVTARNFFSREVAAGARCMVVQHLQSRQWYVFAADCA